MITHVFDVEASREVLRSILKAFRSRDSRGLKDYIMSLLPLLVNTRGTCNLVQIVENILESRKIKIPRNISNIAIGDTCLNPQHLLATIASIAYMVVAQRG